jgi:hypothetical protein
MSKWLYKSFGSEIDSDEINWPLLAPDGSVGAPSYSWSSSPTSGFYYSGASIRGAVNGVNAFNFTNTYVYFYDNYLWGTGDIGTPTSNWANVYAGNLQSKNGPLTLRSGSSVQVFGNLTDRRWTFQTAGDLDPEGDGTQDIGNVTQRVKDFHTKGLLVSSEAKSATYDVASGDSVIEMDASGGARTVRLPGAQFHPGRVIYIKKTDSSANAVTVDAQVSEEIDGALTVDLLLQYECVQLVCNGTSWSVV